MVKKANAQGTVVLKNKNSGLVYSAIKLKKQGAFGDAKE